MVAWTVSEVARFSGGTVRALHHYDEIGLLRPSGRTQAGYRLYEHPDLVRLQRVLAYRRLGIGLDKIAAILDDPDTDPSSIYAAIMSSCSTDEPSSTG